MANEKRLIDANELYAKLGKMAREPYYQHNGEDYFVGIAEAAGAVAESPTVDAVEVVHGGCGWCKGDYHTKIMAKAIRCHSNGNMSGYEMKVNYCPNCGAKMDGGNEDG